MVLEILCHFDSLIFIIVEIKLYRSHKKKVSPSNFNSTHQSQKVTLITFILDIIGVMPLNIFFNSEYSGGAFYFISFLRILRLIQVIRLFKIFSYLESQFKNLTEKAAIIKTSVILLCVWHWSACLWMYFNIHVMILELSRSKILPTLGE